MTMLVFALAQNITDADPVIWELENYNRWNLPFMKTVEIMATDKTINFPRSRYKMEVDPSAYFSVVFTNLDIMKVEDPISLNYTFYGSKNYIVNGTWTEMQLQFNKLTPGFFTEHSQYDYNITLKVFVAYGVPPESGLDGSLGMAFTTIGDEYCALCTLNHNYNLPT